MCTAISGGHACGCRVWHKQATVEARLARSLAARTLLVDEILALAAGRLELASANWTASTVHNRLKNAARAQHNAAA